MAEGYTMRITDRELFRCKRAVVVLSECFKAAMGGKQGPLELRKDLQALTEVLGRLDAIATVGATNDD